MGGQASLQSVLKELYAHAEKSGDDALLDPVIAMEGKIAEGGAMPWLEARLSARCI